MTDFAAQRTKMIESQVRTEDVSDYDVIAAMVAIPRERFVPPRLASLAYIDQDLPIDGGSPSSRFIVKPATLARLVQLAAVNPNDRVLDVGCGTGYSTAILACLGANVVGLEQDRTLTAFARGALAELGVANAKVVEGLLEAGHPAEGPYDVILIGGAVELVPETFFDQLAENGRLVTVVGQGRAAPATLYTKSQGDIGRRAEFDADVPPLPGFARPKTFVF